MDNIDNTIIDSTKPNAGRIYDYLIGGNHSFDIDKQMAKQLIKIAPFLPKQAKFIRWFLHEAIRTANKQGLSRFLDLASGLPVSDHIHNNSPEGTKVIYSDIDPVTVAYGRDIIGENSFVKYLQCDAGTPEIILKSDVVQSLFGNNHKAAIGLSGICWFLTDEQVSHSVKTLYEWADEGSLLYLSDVDSGNTTKEFHAFRTLYENMNQPIYLRSKNELIELIKPWKLVDPGFLLLEEWYDLPTSIAEEGAKLFSTDVNSGSGVFGGFLSK